MDILFTVMELAPRNYPSGLHLVNIGYLPKKYEWIDLEFETYNYSLILEGKGRYESPGYSTDIVAPCVITQAPGRIQSYGPDEAGWKEIYLIYDKKRLPVLKERGIWPQPTPVWSVQCLDLFRDTTQLLISRLKLAQSSEQADYLDRLVEQCILTSLMRAPLIQNNDPMASKVLSIRRIVEANLSSPVDWETLAASVHMSLSTFRRHWLKFIGTPPAIYLTRKRMEEAARLLATSKLSIKQIAEQVGYDDPLHFSRVFRRYFGTAPRDYRNGGRKK
ncbi:AraC family transcriptional regulator [Rubellicoccus peritrichatus]|uniref:AraC family transcriptional regulator n=1 Tax=Rubellicoccus peritrichatus TaxID=3080537 RepID=A0AAQ3QVU7_9BACT|nr:AraC family transcriptional regulator [Puniceicoccus sp. CR14]WOO42003.1 AraC family transcriptional regulator [Puniceicoccus sp. CR14]